MSRYLAAVLVMLSVAALPLTEALAQDQDQDSVNQRLLRLEQGLNEVQRQLYHSEVNGTAPSDADSGAPPAPAAGGSQPLNTEIRLSNLESQMRDLTGQLEEAQNSSAQLKNRLDKMQADNELRFHALEHPGSGPAVIGAETSSGSPPPDGGTTAPTPADTTTPGDQSGPTPLTPDQNPQGAGDMSRAPSVSGTLVAPGDTGAAANNGDNGTPPADGSTPPATSGESSTSLPDGTPEQQYSFAFNLLRQANYPGAESAFKQFLKAHPKDSLAGNAQYWLGETFFARNQYLQAAAIFAQGYQKYPKSVKAPDNLLKLGISLGNIGKKQQACLSFLKLEHQYPTMVQAIHDRERQEKKQFGCGGAASDAD